jgi:hypothetical protein
VLDHASSVNEAIGLIRSCYLASSRTLVLCDARTTAVVEFPGAGSGSAAAVEVGPEFAHTNHFLNPGLAAVDELNVFARNSSQRRLDTCHKRLNELPPNAGPEDHMALLSTAPINVAPTADIRTERTVAAVVLRPEQGELHLRPGDPAGVATQVYALHRAHRPAEVVT